MSKEHPLILIADDEADILAVYKKKLEQSGFEVITACDGVEVLKLAAERQPDLVLMDIKMPNKDGITAKEELNRNPETKNIPVVFLTAFSDPVSYEMYQALEKGEEEGQRAPDVIKKGEDLKDFVTEVRGFLEKVN